MRELPQAFAAMRAYKQFGVYFTRPSSTRPGKLDKFPCDFRTGRVVDAHDPAYWTDADTAIAAAANLGGTYGVRFTFTDADPFWFADLDDALLPDGKGWKPHAVSICQYLTGAAVEVSVSGTGLHLFGTGRPPAHGCESKFGIGGFYHNLRYVALTGIGATGDAGHNCAHLLPGLVDTYWKPNANAGSADGWTSEPCAEWRGPSDDEDLLRRMMNSRSAAASFGNKATFADLWTANVEALARSYPDDSRPYNESVADSALAQLLAFWTGKNCERIESFMRRSALCRDKYDRADNEYGTYLRRTIMMCCAIQFEVLTDKAPEPVAGAANGPLPSASNEPVQPKMVTGSTFANNDEQVRLFAGCVYIQDMHRVLIPGGVTLKPEQFKVAYGGYTFTMDTANEKTSRDAWEAFTQSQAYRCPRAAGMCFKPNEPAGALLTIGDQVFANTYWPVEVPRKVGDPTPFLEHMKKVLPDERDRYILLCYMAACVQHKGYKFQWAPLLQGVEGNGKTLFTRCVAEAIGRRYVHWPKASQIASNFNGWLVGKLFFGVEDVYIPGDRAEIFEILKPMITGGDGLEIERKGIDQISADICGNFIFNSNHKDAIRKTWNDRRFCNFFSAQQDAADLARDGMTGDYFPKLYNWLKSDGYAIVSELLHTFPIPDEYNPAKLCQRAPTTSSTAAAVEATAGGVEQELKEAIAQGLPGFCGGWISSIQLDRLLERLGAARRVTHIKRKEMLELMGYVIHPALADGRVANPVLPDGGKPRLFIRNDSPYKQITNASETAKNYESLNNHTRMPFPVN